MTDRPIPQMVDENVHYHAQVRNRGFHVATALLHIKRAIGYTREKSRERRYLKAVYDIIKDQEGRDAVAWLNTDATLRAALTTHYTVKTTEKNRDLK